MGGGGGGDNKNKTKTMRETETETDKERLRERENFITQGYKFKDKSGFLSLMTNTATLNTSNKYTNNYGKTITV